MTKVEKELEIYNKYGDDIHEDLFKLHTEFKEGLNENQKKQLKKLQHGYRNLCEMRQRYYDLSDYLEGFGFLTHFKEILDEE